MWHSFHESELCKLCRWTVLACPRKWPSCWTGRQSSEGHFGVGESTSKMAQLQASAADASVLEKATPARWTPLRMVGSLQPATGSSYNEWLKREQRSASAMDSLVLEVKTHALSLYFFDFQTHPLFKRRWIRLHLSKDAFLFHFVLLGFLRQFHSAV